MLQIAAVIRKPGNGFPAALRGRKEMVTHLMVYLIGLVMWFAGREHGADRYRLSFTGGLHPHRLRDMIACFIFGPS